MEAAVGNSGPFVGYDFRTAYAAGVSQDGTGQSVGLFELSGYDSDDIAQYESEAALNVFHQSHADQYFD